MGGRSNAQFMATVPNNFCIGKLAGIATFFVSGLPIAKIIFETNIGSISASKDFLPFCEKKYKTVFASYASQDRNDVLSCIQGLCKGRPDLEIFIDIAKLRSGFSWRAQLQHEILRHDALILFWSRAASVSKYVDWEWRSGNTAHGLSFIDPIPLEPPDLAPPPKELAELHFNDWMLAYKRFALSNSKNLEIS